MASAPTSYTAKALSDDDPQLDIGDLFINDEFPIIDNEDDDDLSLDGLEEVDNPPPYYTGTLCVVSSSVLWICEYHNSSLPGLPQKASLLKTWKKLSHLWFHLCCPP